MNQKKIAFILIGIILAIWMVVGVVDFSKVHSFERPIFCIVGETADDGGSGHYAGLGYSFDIKGNFMPEDELKGVTEYSYYLFGIRVHSAIRN